MARVSWAARRGVVGSSSPLPEVVMSSPLFEAESSPALSIDGGSPSPANSGEPVFSGERANDGEPPLEDLEDDGEVDPTHLEVQDGEISSDLWVGAIFYMEQMNSNDFLELRPTAQTKKVEGYTLAKFRAARGAQTQSVAHLDAQSNIRFLMLQNRAAATHTAYGPDSCLYGHKAVWRRYCHAAEGDSLWDCPDVTKKGPAHDLLVTPDRAADFLHCRSRAFTGKGSGKGASTQVATATGQRCVPGQPFRTG